MGGNKNQENILKSTEQHAKILGEWQQIQEIQEQYALRGHSLGIIHRRVLRECEVVGNVLVIGQPAVCPYQPIWTHSDLERNNDVVWKWLNISNLNVFSLSRLCLNSNLAHVKVSAPGCLSPGWWRSDSGSLVPLPGPEEGCHSPPEAHTCTQIYTEHDVRFFF